VTCVPLLGSLKSKFTIVCFTKVFQQIAVGGFEIEIEIEAAEKRQVHASNEESPKFRRQ